LGGQLLHGEKQVEIFADACEVLAEVGQVQGMSGHGDTDDLSRFISNQDPELIKKIFLVHGEYATQKAFCDRLSLKGFTNVEIPSQNQEFDLDVKKTKAA
jgi:metallo-beta-lactamase family protein